MNVVVARIMPRMGTIVVQKRTRDEDERERDLI